MSWAKVDDQLHGHRKAKLAWKYHPRALGLHLLALSYCAGHLTDGFVDLEFVEEKLPAGRERENVTAALVNAGLWVPENGGWRINDWLDYNPSRAEVLDKRAKDSARKARGKNKESAQSPNGVHTASRAGARAPIPAVPDPTQSPPSPPVGGRQRDRIAFEGKLAEFCAEHFPGVPAGLVNQQADSLRQAGVEPTVEALRPLIERWHPTVEAPAA